MKQLTINSVTYKSFAAAYREIALDSVSWALARKRRQRGWPPYKALTTPPIEPQARRAGVNAL